MTQPSPLYRLIEAGLQGSLADFVAKRRPARSWRDIADEIRELTSVRVHDETVRLWFAEREQTGSAV